MNLDRIKKIHWKKVGRWQTSFLMGWLITNSTSRMSLQKIGFPIWFHNFMIIGDGPWDYYFTENDYKLFVDYYKSKLREEGINYFKNYARFLEKDGRAAIDFSLKVKGKNFSNFSNKELEDLFSQFIKFIEPNLAWGYVIQAVDEVLVDLLKEKLGKFLKKEKDISADVLIAELTPPKTEALMIRERKDLLKISFQIYNDKKLKSLFKKSSVSIIEKKLKKFNPVLLNEIKNHQKKYNWMNSTSWYRDLYNLFYYIKRIKVVIENNPNIELDRIINDRKSQNRKVAKLINRIEKSGCRIKEETNIIREFINAKMFNWDSVSISGNNFRGLFIEIGKRSRLSYKDVIFLSSNEIYSILQGEQISKNLPSRRMKYFGLMRLENEMCELNKTQIKEFKKFLEQEKECITEIKGQVAFRGKVKEKVCVIPTADFIKKIKKSNILVCPMTDPDYIPAISKASAIITDEGGILCHAAIISREFKKPCIIGTKIATKVLKDGDLVEVDADKGAIKIFKNEK